VQRRGFLVGAIIRTGRHPAMKNEANTLKHLKMTATVALPASDMEAAELMVASKPAWHAFCEAVREACPGVEVKLEVLTPEPVKKERKRRVVAVVDHKPSARRAASDAA
jgi:NADP-dependent 3-hydroxy acid dehydrogenase YdfG